jgi:nucleoside-specific outer membrane channel protein Tsx
MKTKILLGAVLAAALVSQAGAADLAAKKKAAAAPAPAPYFLFADTTISYSFYTRAKEPSIQNPVQKNLVSLTHFDVTKWGTNFVNIDVLKSNDADVARNSTRGALEVYGLYRGTLSGNYLAGSKAFAFGPVKDVSLAFGGDANSKDTTFGPQKRLIVGGVQFDFNVPGVLNVAVLAGKEYNHCGICTGAGNTTHPEFNTNAHIEINYMQPLAFTGLPLKFSGYTNIVTPKGKDGFGVKTKTEVLSDNRLTLDFGKIVGYQANKVDTFVGYRYWLNKFGNDSQRASAGGAIENQIYVGLAYHL